MLLNEHDAKVRKQIRQERQQEANHLVTHGFVDRNIPETFGPLSTEQIAKRYEHKWVPMLMRESGAISDDEYRAACELLEFWEAITRDVAAKTQDLERVRAERSGTPWREPSHRDIDLARKYDEWCEAAKQDRWFVKRMMRFLDLVQCGLSFRQVERERGTARLTCQRIVKHGLKLYVKLHFTGEAS